MSDARLERILAELPPADAVYLSERLELPFVARNRRLTVRDRAIREALALLEGNGSPSERLCELLVRCAAGASDLPPDWPMRELLSTILDFGEGDGLLKARQIRNIAAGARTPDSRQ